METPNTKNAIDAAIQWEREHTSAFPKAQRPADTRLCGGSVADFLRAFGEDIATAGEHAERGQLLNPDGSIDHLAAWYFRSAIEWPLCAEYWEDGCGMAREATERQIAKCRAEFAAKATA